MTKLLTHPTLEELSAFSLGQLSAESSEAVETHIGECQPCCETLLGLSSDDTFVALLQEANQPPSDETLDQLANSQDTSVMVDGEIPPPLVNHPRYAIVAPVGKGGMGDVFKAEHRMMERTVALKVIKRELFRKPEAVHRFRREVRTAAKLCHPNIVTAYDAEQAGDVHFLVMEYVDGVDLGRRARDDGALPMTEACEYIRQAALGLQHAHEQGMVHRDIKPHNLMVTGDGTVKILDFGLATLASDAITGDTSNKQSDDRSEKSSSSRLTTMGTMMGTPDFISPEQAGEPHAVDIRSDIYGLGCTFYYLLTGRPPFAEGSVMEKVKAHTDQQAKPIKNVRADVPAEVADVVRRMMAKDPAERFQTPAEVADALAPFVEAHRTGPVEVAASPSLRSWWPPSTFQTLAFGAFALILCAIIYVATDRGTLVVESVDDSVEIRVGRVDEDLRITDTVTGSTVKWLSAGEYELNLEDDKNECELSQNRFILKRGGKVIVKVTRKARDDEGKLKKGVVVRQVWPDAKDTLGAVSPDGRYLSFVDWDTGDLAVRDLVLKTNRHITNKSSWDASNAHAEYSKFSPDGKQLVYTWFFDKQNRYELRTIDFEGGEPQVIYACDDADYIAPMDWSPDGTQILAVLSRKDKTNEIALVSVEDKTVTVVKPLDWRYPGEMSFSPDGKYIVYDLPQPDETLKHDLFVIATDRSSEIPLIEHSADDVLLGWCPDGRRILFASNRTRTWDAWLVDVVDGKRHGEPVLVKPEIGDVIPIGFTSEAVYHFAIERGLSEVCTASFDPVSGEIGPPKSVAQNATGVNIAPEWSRDGDLAYLSQQGLRGRRTSIIILSASGQERELSPQLSYIFPKPPAWSPDGRSLLVSGKDLRSRRGIFVVDVKSGDVEQIADGNAFGEWSPDGKAVYIFLPRDGRIYRRELESKQEREIVQAIDPEIQGRNRVRFVVSPDGERIAFTTTTNEKKPWVLAVRPIAGDDDMHLYEIPKGRWLRRLQWTADGKSLLIGERVEDKHVDKHVFSMIPAHGGVPRKLDLNVEGVQYLKMHPDGKQVALNVTQKGTTEISAMENFLTRLKDDKSTATTARCLLSSESTDVDNFYEIRPSPDGRRVAYSEGGFGALCVRDLETGKTRELTPGVRSRRPVWSPDSKRIAFNDDDAGLHIVDVDSAAVSTPTRTDDLGMMPRDWSPDGTHLVCTSNVSEQGPSLVLVTLPNGTVRHLVNIDRVRNTQAAFSRDGRYVAYSSTEGKNQDIFIIATDGSNKLHVTNGSGPNTAPLWSPDGRTLVYSTSEGIYAVDVIDGRPEGHPNFVRKPLDTPLCWSADAGLCYVEFNHVSSFNALPVNRETGEAVGGPLPALDMVEGARRYSWSPDMKTIAAPRPKKLLLYSTADRMLRTLPIESERIFKLWWSGDGKHVLYINSLTDRGVIFSLNPNDGTTKPLTPRRTDRGMMELSRDGRRLLFYRGPGVGRGHPGQRQLVVTDLGNDDDVLVLVDEQKEQEDNPDFGLSNWVRPRFSPDGSHVLYGTMHGDLWVATVDGSSRRKIETVSAGESTFLRYAAWHPEGRYIAYDDRQSIHVVNVQTRESREVLPTGASPRSVGVMQWSPDGNHIGYRSESVSPELWSVKNLLGDGGKLK